MLQNLTVDFCGGKWRVQRSSDTLGIISDTCVGSIKCWCVWNHHCLAIIVIIWDCKCGPWKPCSSVIYEERVVEYMKKTMPSTIITHQNASNILMCSRQAMVHSLRNLVLFFLLQDVFEMHLYRICLHVQLNFPSWNLFKQKCVYTHRHQT